MHRFLTVMGSAVLIAALGVTAMAQVGARFVLRNGQQISGELVDMGTSGLEVRSSGQTRKWGIGEVAVVDFTGGSTFPANEVAQAGGEHLLVLRSGQMIKGTLYDIGGTAPLRVTFSHGGMNHDYTSNDVARIYFAKPGTATTLPGGTTTEGLSPASGRVRVDATAGWVNTGLQVSQGQTLLFTSTGEVRLSSTADDVAGPAGSTKGRFATGSPVPSVLAGALIGRVGNGAPFAIGNQTSVPSPGTGLLYLAVNDDALGDNAGAFGVDVTAQARIRR